MRDALADARSQLQGLYYDTTFSANSTVFGCLRQLAPATHILLGTDFPVGQEVGVQLNIDGLEQLINNEDRQAMERDNALALFPRLQPHTA